MNRVILGAVFILLGVALYFNQGNPIGLDTIFTYFWPSLFVIPLGLFFHWLYFNITGPKGIGLLIPGGILFTAGLVCQISMLLDNWEVTWPGFILAVAIGLFEFYWFGNRNKYMLIPVGILSVVGLLFAGIFAVESVFNRLVVSGPVFAIILVALGVYSMMGGKRKA